MAGQFSAKVDQWVAKSQRRLTAVFRTAAEAVFDDVIDRTRVDTGYMRASFQVTLNEPRLLKRGEGPEAGAAYPSPSYSLAIAGAKIGDVIYGSFTAEYAPVWEFRDGMVRLAAQAWPQHVANAVAAAKVRVG